MKRNAKIFFFIISIGFVVFIISQYFYQLCFVRGISMEPTLHEGQMLLIKKFNLKLNYNDIIVINKNNKIIIKKLVGLPYDTVQIHDYVYINGEKKDNIYIQNPGNAEEKIILKQDEFFVLGDNRQKSIDSRFDEIGIITKKDIIGKAFYKMF